MLPRRDSSRTRYREYLARRRTDPKWSEGEKQERAAKPKRTRDFRALMREFWGLVRAHRGAIVLSLLTLTVTTAVALVIPAVTKVAIDYVITDNPGPDGLPERARVLLGLVDAPASDAQRERVLWLLGAGMVVLASVSVGIGMVGRWQMTRVTKRVQVELRRKAFEHAVRLPLARVQHYKSGGMASLLREDAGLAGDLLFGMFYNPWRAIITLIGTLVVLAYTDWRFVLGGLLCIPAVWVTHKTWISRIRPLYRDAKHVRQSIDATTTEAFAGLRVVRGFARQRSESWRFVAAQHQMTRIEVLTWWWSRIIDVSWSILIPLATASVLVYGGSQVIRGGLTIGDLMMFTTYLLMLLGPLETLTSTASNIQNNLAAFDRVLALLDEPEEFAGVAGGAVVNKETSRGEFTLENVWFSYPIPAKVGTGAESAGGNGGFTDAPPAFVLEEINLRVRAGETIALVGPSGSGKTTLCNLVARFYDPTRGRVLLDGRNLREIDVASYRSLLGIVEQDVFLFDGTIAENIAYASRDATARRIIDAAQAANAHEFITQLEKGYETIIGERGVRLSGGQKQRIAIARALLADPLILILDEATSNLDTQSEHLIQQSMTTLTRGRTCFVIAHRLSTVRNADRIVVMEKGKIIEVGAHDELLASRGMYSHLVSLQMEGRGGGEEKPDGMPTTLPASHT